MARELELMALADQHGEPTGDVKVSIVSDEERDVSVHYDAQDLILAVARVMGWSVAVDFTGGAAIDPGVGGA